MAEYGKMPDVRNVVGGLDRRISALERPAAAQRRIMKWRAEDEGYGRAGFAVAGVSTSPDYLGDEIDILVPEDRVLSVFAFIGFNIANGGSGTVAFGISFGEAPPGFGLPYSLCQTSLTSTIDGYAWMSAPGSDVGAAGLKGGAVIFPASGGLVPVNACAWNVSGASGRIHQIDLWAWVT